MQAKANRFDMPTVFGASLLPDTSPVERAQVAAISFETEPDAARQLLPKGLDLADIPIVSVTRITYPSVEYLGGRGYNEIVVGLTARAADGGKPLQASYSPVMWVDQVGALISGREFMGFAKLAGEMSVMDLHGPNVAFDCREYSAPLLRAKIGALQDVTGEKLARINKSAREVVTLGWKYIPGPDGDPDVNYPLANVTRWSYRRAWTGEGSIEFCNPGASEAPFSARIAAALGQLPIKAYRPAFVAEGDVVIDRTATRRLGD